MKTEIGAVVGQENGTGIGGEGEADPRPERERGEIVSWKYVKFVVNTCA